MNQTFPTCLPTPRTEEWWTPKFQQQIAYLAGIKISTLMIGDSLAANWPKHVPWPGGGTVYRFAIGGDRTQHILWRLMQLDLADINPDQVVIFAGANNITSGPTEEAVAEGILSIVRHVRAQLPDQKVTTMAVPLRGANFEYKRGFIDRVNQLVGQQVGTLKSRHVDTNPAFLCASNGVNPSYLFDDEVHYSAVGYTFMAGYIDSMQRHQPF